MKNRARRSLVAVVLLLLSLVGTASAECAWVLWSRIATLPRMSDGSDWTDGGGSFSLRYKRGVNITR
jgi:hypothetical protein